MRINDQCQTCACYYTNWGTDVEKEMEEMAPGEECSQGQNTLENDRCPGYSEKEHHSTCPKCGQLFVVHNDDGSCVED